MSVPANREIDVPGVKNFRDLGGLVGLGERTVRRGLVFRSAKFDKILPEGEAVLDALGIRT
ncbi:MAG: tyrosine-protein phosphatase, partial [Opitutales bacterium]|nr:tyrosine-protein phosphatase [Opitutales bacterium]